MGRRPGKFRREALRAIGSMMKRSGDDGLRRLAGLAHRLRPELTVEPVAGTGMFVVRDGDLSATVARRTRLHTQITGIAQRRRWLAQDYMIDDRLVRPGDLVIDCGANIGEVAMICAGLGARVIAFEPDPTEFEALSANAAATGGISAHRLALWNETGTLDFYPGNDTGDSSLIASGTAGEPIRVETRRLDDLGAVIGADDPIRLLKLEAEGAEPEILEGAMATLDRVDYVSVDMGPERGLTQDNTVPQVVNRLCAAGFRLRTFRQNRCIGLFVSARLSEEATDGPA